MYNLLPDKKAWAKDFVYGLNADVKEMFNNPSVELGKAASDFNISLKDINKNKQGIQQEIEEKRSELIENKSEEEVEKINQQALILTNQSNVALYSQYVNPRKEFTDREIFETGYNLINGKKLNARQSEVAAQVPSAVIYESIKSTDSRSARETMQYLDAKQRKYEAIEATLNHESDFKTSWRTEKQRTKVANLLDEALNLTSEKLRLQGKDKSIRTPEENSRILDLELQIEQSFKDAKYISDKAFEDGFRKINKEAGRIGKEKIVVLSQKDFNSKAEEVTGEALSEKDGVLGFFDEATSTRYVNEDAARATKTITTAMHETGHFVLKDSLKDKATGKVSEDGIRIIDEVLSELNESQRELIQKRIDENYRFDDQGKEIPKEEYYEEYLTVLSEEIADKNIVFNKNIGEALLDIVPFMRKSGLPSLEMSSNTGRELFNLISSYSSGKAAGARKATQLSEIESESEGVSMSKKSEKPKAIFMIGGPGAGKTNVGKGLKLGRRGFKVVNQDIALEAMKEDAGLPAEESEYTAEQRSLRSKLGASSVKAAKEKFNQYVSNKNDMVIDGTGASYNATMKKVKELEGSGYDVFMVAATSSLPVALDRNQARKERSLPDKIVTKTYNQVQESLAKYKQDFGNKLYEVNTEAIEYGKDLPQDFLDKVYKGVGVEERQPMYSKKKTVLEEINNLIPEGIKTKEQFLSDRSFTKIYESAMNPGGAINNYIKSRTTSAMEAELAVDSVLERLMNFDPQAKRKDGSIIGREGFGEFIFANTAFGKLDAKKKMFLESKLKSKETRIDESTKQIADTETLIEEEAAPEKEKPSINPLKFEGVPENIELSDAPGKGLTFKKVGKQYAGEVGEQAIGIRAKKITESSANLGSLKEARDIQQFFFKGNNLERFIKILPEFNVANKVTKIGIEKLDVPGDVFGTSLGLPNRVIRRFYEPFVDPTGAMTSESGRSRGRSSQTAVFRLKKEFRGTISKETLDQLKGEMGITPKGELNILPKGELRSPIGQLLKGMVKTYSTLAANTLVRQKMTEASASKEEVARVAGGKRDIMLSKKVQKELGSTRTIKDVYKVLKDNGVDLKDINTTKEIDILHSEIEEIIKLGGITLEMFRSAKFTNFGVKTVYGEFDKDGKFVEFSKKEKDAKGSNKLKFKYYALKNNEFVKVPVKKNQLGNLVEDKEKADKIKRSRSGDFTPDRSDIYYGIEDPAYKRAEELARQNTELEAKEPKRVSVRKAGTKEANEQFATNLDVLEEMTIKLADAVNNKKLSADAAVKFITKAYQATSGVIKISAPFKYKDIDPKYAGEYGKPEQNKGELIREEHTVPASVIGGYLIHGILTNKAKEAMNAVRKNFFQVVLGKQYDVILDKAKLDATLAEGSSLFDENVGAIRMLTANVLTENIKRLPRMNFNNIVNIETNESWAKEIGVVLPKEYETVDNLNLQNRLLLDKIKGERKYSNHQEYLNKHIKLKTNEAAAANQSRLKNVTTKFSKKKDLSNKEILNDLSNRDKALRNARNAKAKAKGISVFDFDDTLATTKSMVRVTMPDGTETKIDATEFAKRGDELLKQGAEFDFSDFSRVVDGEPGPLISKLDKAINKFGNKDVFVLTARPANSASAIHEFLKGLGYEIPLENITGLANSSPEAKAQWMVDKAAEGYNDFYFTDDAYKNVKAVQDAMRVLDVKSKERIVYKDAYEKLDREFNDILEAKTGIASEKRYSDAKAEVIGVSKGKFNFFISPSAEDFVGLLYSTLSKGKLGENQMAWYKKNLLDPYTRAMNNIANERMALAADYKALKKQLGVVPRKLKQKIKGEGFNKEQAVRIYIWNKQGFDVPGLSKTDLADMTKYVENDATLQVFADQLVEITKGDGYATPGESWMAGSITTDLLNTLQVTKRAKHLEEWQQNVDVIFSKENLNKMEAAYGSTYRGAMENMLQRMKSGKNRNFDGDSLTGKFLDWVNGSTGAIMFFNTRSAILQTISAVNFINWSDNNVFKASAAFANQKQYWKDFTFLFNSDFLKERRDNLTINVNEADIAEMANKGGAKGALAYLLQKGFLPTQIADGFAIASGGSTFYRNRIKTYLKEGMSQKEAETKAFEDFREAAEESQQSSRPDRISQQQAGPLGRVVLAFANTPSQYARIIKKASLDLANNRGDFKTNLSKIMYYSVIQGVIFTSLQSALFAADFDDEEEMDNRIWKMSNSVVDGIMRGAGVQGAVTSVVKNATLKAIEESEKKSPKYNKVVNEIVRISPPVSSKISKLQQAAREVQWNRKEMETKGFGLDNPAWLAAGNVISATTNVPADRVIKKINNVDYALSQELELYERLALLGGWQKWELGLDKKEKEDKGEGKSKFNKIKYRTTKYRTIKYK